MVQFDAQLQKSSTTEDTKSHEGLVGEGFPWCTFVPFVVKTGLARKLSHYPENWQLDR